MGEWLPRALSLGSGRSGRLLMEPRSSMSVTTLDADERLEPDMVCDLGLQAIPCPADTFDYVEAVHVLEHIGRQGETRAWFFFWEELYRVMRPGGIFQVESPLYSSVWCWADPSHTRAISEQSFVFLNQDAYRIPNSSISPFRIACDFTVEWFERIPDRNPDVASVEGTSHLRGVLRARKPLKPWWEA
jgi:SAM-dependent methyltransferase